MKVKTVSNWLLILASVTFLPLIWGGATPSYFADINYQQSLPPVSIEQRTNGARLRFRANWAEKFTIERSPALTGPWTKIAARSAPQSALLQYDDTNLPPPVAYYRASHTNSGIPMTPDKLPMTTELPDFQIAYGAAPDQKAELRVPASNGLHPVVILIHGGCWQSSFSTLRDLASMGEELKALGYATWNVEYRRLGQAGGGWPGTYQDVGHAVDYLRTIAGEHHLDLSCVLVLGHSAGGHLAMWVAARSVFPKKVRCT